MIHGGNEGVNKAASAGRFVEKLNNNVKVDVMDWQFNPSNALQICSKYDLIIDCCDNPETRYLANECAVKLQKAFISGASVRWDGQLSVYVRNCKGEKLPCYKCINPTPPTKEEASKMKCNAIGVMPTAPGIIGTLEANEAIKFLLGLNDNLLQKKMLIFDGLDLKFRTVKLRERNEKCSVCGDK